MSTDDEAAAAIVALLLRAEQGQEPPPGPTNWNSRHHNLRVPLPRGRDAWRLSLRTP